MRRHAPIVGHVLEAVCRILRRDRFSRLVAPSATCTLMWLAAGCGGGSPSGPTPPAPPTLTCPADVEVDVFAGEQATVTYTTPTPSNGAPPVTVACAPGSGSSFDAGTSQVSCTATDAQSRNATCGFKVIVTVVPQIEKVKFLAFGDSVTEGTISSPCPANESFDTLWMRMAVVAPESYPYKLQGLLAGRYRKQTIDVVNEGKAGERVIGAAERRLPGVLAASRPEVLLLLHGFNDLLTAGRNDAFDAVIPLIAGALEDMVRTGRAQNATVLLATLPAMDENGCRGQGAPGVRRLNDLIRRAAADEGAVLVDLYGGLGGSPAGVIGIDGMHPTETGYTKMAQVWFDAIQREFERPSPTGTAGPIVPPADRIR